MNMVLETILIAYVVAYTRQLGLSKGEANDIGQIIRSAVAYTNTNAQIHEALGTDYDMMESVDIDAQADADRAEMLMKLPHFIGMISEIDTYRSPECCAQLTEISAETDSDETPLPRIVDLRATMAKRQADHEADDSGRVTRKQIDTVLGVDPFTDHAGPEPIRPLGSDDTIIGIDPIS